MNKNNQLHLTQLVFISLWRQFDSHVETVLPMEILSQGQSDPLSKNLRVKLKQVKLGVNVQVANIHPQPFC